MSGLDKEAKRGRVFLHQECEGETRITEGDFVEICNPMYYPRLQGVLCCACKTPSPLTEVAWSDTQETIADFRERMRGKIPDFWRVLVAWGWMPAGILIGGTIGGVIFSTSPKAHWSVGFGIGALVGMYALSELLEPTRVAGWLKIKFHHQK